MMIFRLEDKHGRGPYASQMSAIEFFLKIPKQNGQRNPMPQTDFGVPIDTLAFVLRCKPINLLFGCRSKEELLSWFGIENEDVLSETNFKIITYFTEKYVISKSGKQVVFCR